VAAAVRARRHLLIVARTDAAASESLEAAVARAQLYVQAGADAIFAEALTWRDMVRERIGANNPVYLSFDIDGIDPAPSGAPRPGRPRNGS
jgi:2-methylisocitrate lyase-like PEP mutase family enzyme